jgi:hypothetical protein
MCSRHRQLATFIEYNGTYFIAVFSLPTIHIQESCPSFYPSPIHHPPSPISHIYLPLPFCKLTHGSSPPILLPLFHSPTSTASHLPTTHPLPPTSFLQQDHWNPLAKASYSIKVHASPLTSGSKSCQTLCSGLTSRLPGWWMHVVEVLAVEYSVPQFRHWDCAFRFCGREGLGGV